VLEAAAGGMTGAASSVTAAAAIEIVELPELDV
jgi:hypothetical protein